MRPSPSGVRVIAAVLLMLAPVAAGERVAGGVENIRAGVVAPDSADAVEAAQVTPADDAYHYAAFRDGRHDALYTEWWYFNLHDPRAGVSAIFSYFVTNPEDIGGLAMVQMVAVAYTNEGTVTAIDRHPAAAFEAAEDAADVRLGGNRVRIGDDGVRIGDDGVRIGGDGVRLGDDGGRIGGDGGRIGGDGEYRVSGASLDGRLAWELRYVADSVPWFAFDRMPVGRLAWEKMSWLVQMPRARVTGTLTVDGRPYALHATGYHDHNWGEWIPTNATWNWAQFSSPRLSLEVGDFIGKPIGVVALDLDGERTVFTPKQYSLVHTRWGWDRTNRLFYPTESILTADNGALRLEVTLRALATEPLRGDLPRPLKDLIIYEQTARYEGRVREWVAAEGVGEGGGDGDGGVGGAAAPGEWRVRAWVRGTGFKEWTGKKY